MEIHNKLSLNSILLQDNWFGSCSRQFQEALIEMGRIKRYSKGEVIFDCDIDDDLGLLCIVNGSLCIFNKGKSGQTSILAFLEPCHWFGELPLIDKKNRKHIAIADKDAVIFIVPRQQLNQWLDKNPENWLAIARLCACKLRIAYEFLDYSNTKLQDVAKRIFHLSYGFGSQPQRPKGYIEISQEKLGLILNMSRVSANRILSSLEDSGAIRCQYGGIKILNMDLLKKIADIQ